MDDGQARSGLETMREAGDRLLALHEQMRGAMADMTRAAIEAAAEGTDPAAIGQEYTRLSPDSVPLPRAGQGRRNGAVVRQALPQLADQDDEPGAKPVRTTVDLSPSLHRHLKRWAGSAAEELAVPELPLAEVFRALIRRLGQDSDLAAAILGDLRGDDAEAAPPTEALPETEGPKYLSLIRKEARFRPDQLSALSEVRRRLLQERSDRTAEAITDNTLIRVAVDLLLTRADRLQGSSEEEIRHSILPGQPRELPVS